MSDGKVIIDTGLDTSGVKRDLNNLETTAAEKLDKVGSSFQKTGAIMTASLTAPIMLMGSKMVTAASDYDENLNKVDVAFKRNAAEVKAWSETSLKSFGLSKNQALEMTSLYGDMATSMGMGTKEAAKMSTSLAGLAGDLASFKNKSIDEVQTALNGIFTGETESLKQLGIVMTQTNLDAYALANGFGKTTSEMTQAELVALRYAYVMDKTKNAHGDYARTADGTANTLRTFQGSLEELWIVLGQKVLPVFTPLVRNATTLLELFASAPGFVHGFVLVILALLAAAGPLLTIFGTMARGVSSCMTLYGKLTKIIQANTAATAANATAANVAGKAQMFLSKALTVGKFLAIGAAIAAAGYLLYKFAQDSDAATAMINGFVDKVVSMVESLVQALPALIPKLTQAAIDLLLALVNAVPKIIPPLVNAIPQLVIAIAEALPELIPVLIDGAVQLLMALVEAIPLIIPPLVTALPQIITAIVKGLIALAGAILQVGVQLLSKLWSGISSKTGWLKDKVYSFAKSIPGRIAAGLGSLFSIGNNFMQGLLNGINNKIGIILSKVQNLGSRIKSALKRALEVFSPSRFTTWLGEMLDIGLAEGIVDNTKHILSAIRGQGDDIRDEYNDFDPSGGPMPYAYSGTAASNATAAGAAAVTTTQNINIYQPVATPAETARALRNEAMFGLAGV